MVKKAIDLLLYVCLITCKWMVKSNACIDELTSDLVPLFDCKATLDPQRYLHITCNMYSVLQSKTFVLGVKFNEISISWGLRSLNPVTVLNDTVCLRMVNLTMEKSDIIHPNATPGTLMELVPEINQIEEGRMEVVFEKFDTMMAIVRFLGNCNETSLGLNDISCKLNVSVISSSLADRLGESKSNQYKLHSSINLISQALLLHEAKFPLIRIQISSSVNGKKFLDVLRPLKILRLELIKTNFYSLENVDFQGFSTLEVLNLTWGSIQSIQSNAFNDLTKLIKLDLSHNRLQAIPDALYTLTNIVNLTMEGNAPETNQFALESDNKGTSCLTVLRLSQTSISWIKDSSFSTFFLLEELYLDKCNISSISESAFDNLTFLQILDLSDNNIHSLPENVFLSVPSLHYLSLTQNRLSVFADSHVNSLPNLISINLANNQLSQLFNVSPSLSVLDLRANHIKEWSSDNSINFSQLHRLDLSLNYITVVTANMQLVLKNTERVNLSKNPYDCTPCHLYHLHVWLKMPNVESPNLYFCTSPPDLIETGVLQLSSNDKDCIIWKINVILISSLSISILVLVAMIGGAVYYFRWYIRYLAFRLRLLLFRTKTNEPSLRHYDYDMFVSYVNSERNWVAKELVTD